MAIPNKDSGYTFMELLVVLTILSLLMTAIVPVYQGSIGWVRTDGAVRDFMALTKYCQERAVSHGVEYRLYIDKDNGEFWATRYEVDNKGEWAARPLDGDAGRRRELPRGVEVEQLKARRDREAKAHFVAFHPSGACDYATIVIRKRTGDKVTLNTKGRLGQLAFKESP